MSNKSVLIIEDDFDTQFFLGELLKGESYDVVTTSHGKEALAHLAISRPVDLIFMDLNFPFMTPEEFVSELRKIPGSEATPIVLLSGKSNIEEYKDRLNAHSFLKKPFDLDVLLNVVKQVV